MTTTVAQPTAKPTRKVSAAAIAGVLVTVGTAIAAALTDLGVTGVVVAAITTVVSVASAYLKAEAA